MPLSSAAALVERAKLKAPPVVAPPPAPSQNLSDTPPKPEPVEQPTQPTPATPPPRFRPRRCRRTTSRRLSLAPQARSATASCRRFFREAAGQDRQAPRRRRSPKQRRARPPERRAGETLAGRHCDGIRCGARSRHRPSSSRALIALQVGSCPGRVSGPCPSRTVPR